MWVGTLELDLLLGGMGLPVRSLKEKRSVVKPIVAELQRRFAVSASEAGYLDLDRRALVGVAVVGADRAHCVSVLNHCEQLVARRPEIELLAARHRLLSSNDVSESDTELDAEPADDLIEGEDRG